MSPTDAVTAGAAAQTAGPAGPRISRPMNPLDFLMLAVDDSLRDTNLSGFETQTLVWLDGRADANRLRTAVARLGRRFPIVTARLARDGGLAAFWSRRPDGEATLREADLASADDETAFGEAARLLSAPRDLAAADPITFHLLHLPDGRDLFVMQYSHVLMDNSAAVPVLKELERLSDPAADEADGSRDESRDAMTEHLKRHGRVRRWRAAWRLTDLRVRKLRFRPVILGRDDVAPATEPRAFRILARTIERGPSRKLLERVVEICRWPGLSMAILGSVFRALARLAPPREGRRNFVAGIGVDLGLRGPNGPLFQNLSSLFPISARREELGDREALVRALQAQLRERLGQDLDLATVELARLARPFSRAFHRSAGGLLRNNYSLWYAYFGSADAAGDRFCGADIAAVRYACSAWPPVGISLLVNQSRGRTHLQATYLPDVVSDALATEFVDGVVADLTEFAGEA